MLDKSSTMWNHCKVEQAQHANQAGIGARVWRRHPESLRQSGEHIATKSRLSKHLLNLKVLPISKALKLYTSLSLTSMTNCFAPMSKWKLNKCMMNCDDCLRHFIEKLTNWHWISTEKNSCIRGKWLCLTCSNNKVWTLIFVKKIIRLTVMRT